MSNICDGGYIGTEATVSLLGPLLQNTAENPYATLLLLYMNAVKETNMEDPASEEQVVMDVMLHNAMRDWRTASTACVVFSTRELLSFAQDVESDFAG